MVRFRRGVGLLEIVLLLFGRLKKWVGLRLFDDICWVYCCLLFVLNFLLCLIS